MRRSLKFVKLVFIAGVLILSACKNDKKSEAKEDKIENAEEKDFGLSHVPGVLMTMHKETMTFLEIGLEKSEDAKVKEYITDFQSELSVVIDKSNHVFEEKGLEVKDSKLTNVLKEKFKKKEDHIKDLDSEKFDQEYMKNISDYLFDQLGVVETELVPLGKNKKIEEAIHLTMITYKTQADRALNLQRELEDSN